MRCGFNPCSFGCQSESVEHLGLSRRGYPVSILVLLDVSLKASPSVCVYHKQYGFNPCSFGCQSERCRRAAGGHRDCQVSILVLLDVSLKAPILRDRHGERQVSILVLLDVSLKAYPTQASRSCSSSFNPCSFGCQSESSSAGPTQSAWSGFNPCSFGCQSESGVLHHHEEVVDMFQSLFFWMSV